MLPLHVLALSMLAALADLPGAASPQVRRGSAAWCSSEALCEQLGSGAHAKGARCSEELLLRCFCARQRRSAKFADAGPDQFVEVYH